MWPKEEQTKENLKDELEDEEEEEEEEEEEGDISIKQILSFIFSLFLTLSFFSL